MTESERKQMQAVLDRRYDVHARKIAERRARDEKHNDPTPRHHDPALAGQRAAERDNAGETPSQDQAAVYAGKIKSGGPA